MSDKQTRLTLLIILILFAIWRFSFDLIYNWSFYMNSPDQAAMVADGRDFTLLAKSLCEHGEYRMDENSPPYSLRTPGFPIFLAIHMLLLGKFWLLGVLITHIICGVIAVLSAYMILSSMRDHYSGLLGGFLVASYAPYHYMAFIVYREMLSLALFSCLLVLINHKWYKKYTFVLIGTILALMSFIREEFILLTPTCLLLVFWKETEGTFKRNWRPAALKCAVLVALIFMIFLPWIIRNAIVFERLQVFGSLGGVQLYMGNNPEVSETHEYDHAFIGKIKEFETHTVHEVGSIYFRRAFNYIITHPITTVKNMFYKATCLFAASIHNLDDFPALIFAFTLALFFCTILKLKRWAHAIVGFLIVFLIFIFARGFNFGILLPNIEFSTLRFFGTIAFFWAVFRFEFPQYILCYLSLFSVNLIFVPQHRHRWIIDLLFIIWTAILFHDLFGYIVKKLSSPKKLIPSKDDEITEI